MGVCVNNHESNQAVARAAVGLLAAFCGGLAQAAEPQPEELRALRARVTEQTARIDALKRQIADADAQLAEIHRALGAGTLAATRAAGPAAPGGANAASPAPPVEVAQVSQSGLDRPPARPADGRPPQVAQIFEQPGVLTPRGRMVLEPSLQYAYSSSNRVSLVGYTIIPSLLIGLVDVREVKRNTFTPSITGRWGLTNRLEVEAKLPYVYRSDSVLSRPLGLGAPRDELFSSTGSGIGDVEFTGRYQLNDGGADKPYYVGTLRLKSRTGKDPFEVETDNISAPNISNELQKELPTGSGFYTLQPGVTMLYPLDPAVFFGSVSYQHNFKRSGVVMNTTNGPVTLGDIEPGGVLGFNFGMGLSLNDRSSFSIGYDHASVGKTKINGSDAINSVRTQLGSLLLGYSYRIDKRRSLNVSVGAGVTRDTPDVQLSVRLPMMF